MPPVALASDDDTLTLDRRNDTVVKVVNIASNLQFASVVDKSGLVGKVDPNLYWQLNILLDAAKQVLDLLRRPALVWPSNFEENLGVFRWILYPHAAMAIGTDLMSKQLLVRCVVLIDGEPIRKIEPNPPERIPIAWRLGNLD